MTEDDRATGGLMNQERSSEACVTYVTYADCPAQRRRVGYDGHHEEDHRVSHFLRFRSEIGALALAAALLGLYTMPANSQSPSCDDVNNSTACWKEIEDMSDCYLWNTSPVAGETVTWSGECSGSFAEGKGTVLWTGTGWSHEEVGSLKKGMKDDGQWIIRPNDGTVHVGAYMDNRRNGYWTIHGNDRTVQVGAYVNDKRNGHWIIRGNDGTIGKCGYSEGKQTNCTILGKLYQ